MSAHLGLAVTAFIDGELSHSRRDEVLAHLLHCAPCRAEVDMVRRYKSAVREGDVPPVPFDLTARLLSVTADVASPVTVARRASRPHAPRRRARRRGATAGALVAFGLGGALSLGGPAPSAPVAPVDPTSNRFMVEHATTTSVVPFAEPDFVPITTSRLRP